ncbi:MAG: hypothetical protein QXQ40_02585 [Candidatus Aenigmatarchaeota archaeon]
MIKRILLSVLILSSLGFALESIDCFQYYKFQDGIIFDDMHAEKVSYLPGEEVIITYNLVSRMESPIPKGRVRIQIFYNDEREGEQMIDEFFAFEDLYLRFNDVIPQEFKWRVPSNAKSGEYIVKAYFIVGEMFNLAGLSIVPYGPPGVPGEQTKFKVESPSESRIYFSKEETYINGERYPFIGFSPIYNEGTKITIETQLINEGKPKHVDVKMRIYKWDDLIETPMWEYTKIESRFLDNYEKFVFDLPPLSPGTYEVKFVAESREEKSILKLRFSIAGENGRFIYLGIDRFPLTKGEKATIFMCLSNSADYMTNFVGHGSIEISNQYGNTIFRKDYREEILPSPTGFITEFVPDKDYRYIVLKADLYDSENNLMDRVSLIYDYSRFSNIPKYLSVNTDKSEYVPNETVSYTISYTDDLGNPLTGNILLYLLDQDDNIVYDIPNRVIHGSIAGSLAASNSGEYKLIARELDNDIKAEKVFLIREKALDYRIILFIIVIIALAFVALRMMKR